MWDHFIRNGNWRHTESSHDWWLRPRISGISGDTPKMATFEVMVKCWVMRYFIVQTNKAMLFCLHPAELPNWVPITWFVAQRSQKNATIRTSNSPKGLYFNFTNITWSFQTSKDLSISDFNKNLFFNARLCAERDATMSVWEPCRSHGFPEHHVLIHCTHTNKLGRLHAGNVTTIHVTLRGLQKVRVILV